MSNDDVSNMGVFLTITNNLNGFTYILDGIDREFGSYIGSYATISSDGSSLAYTDNSGKDTYFAENPIALSNMDR